MQTRLEMAAQVVKVLVVDDEALIRRIHRAMLTGFGFEVTEIKDAKDAVNSFINQDEYDLVLMDNEMPEMDGVQVNCFSTGNYCSNLNLIFNQIASKSLQLDTHRPKKIYERTGI
jgi:response regulator of citrate/malate metabolism